MSNDVLFVIYEQYVIQSERSHARQEVFWIFQHCLSITWIRLSSLKLSDFPADKVSLLRSCLLDYTNGVPLAYIVRSAPFLDLELYI